MKVLGKWAQVCTSFPVTRRGCSKMMTHVNQQPFNTTTKLWQRS